MKMAIVLGVAVGLAVQGLQAQEEFVAPRPEETPTRPLRVNPEPQPTIEGIVAEVFKDGQPWQLVNPVAPARYGNGRNTISWDPDDAGKPKGFILFGIAFW
jgi:hypothetical protein